MSPENPEYTEASFIKALLLLPLMILSLFFIKPLVQRPDKHFGSVKEALAADGDYGFGYLPSVTDEISQIELDQESSDSLTMAQDVRRRPSAKQ